MDVQRQQLTSDETVLLRYAERRVGELNTIRRAAEDIATLYAFVLSEAGLLHDGGCYEGAVAHATICGERHAIANMVLAESYAARIRALVVADPVPSRQPFARRPCGTCRHLIWKHGSVGTSVLLAQYVPGDRESVFESTERYSIAELFPFPEEPPDDLWKS